MKTLSKSLCAIAVSLTFLPAAYAENITVNAGETSSRENIQLTAGTDSFTNNGTLNVSGNAHFTGNGFTSFSNHGSLTVGQFQLTSGDGGIFFFHNGQEGGSITADLTIENGINLGSATRLYNNDGSTLTISGEIQGQGVGEFTSLIRNKGTLKFENAHMSNDAALQITNAENGVGAIEVTNSSIGKINSYAGGSVHAENSTIQSITSSGDVTANNVTLTNGADILAGKADFTNLTLGENAGFLIRTTNQETTITNMTGGSLTVMENAGVDLDGTVDVNRVTVYTGSSVDLNGDLTVAESSSFGSITSEENSSITLGTGIYSFDEVNGSTNLVVSDLENLDGINIGTANGNVRTGISGTATDQYDSAQMALNELISKTDITTQNANSTFVAQQGAVNDGAELTIDENGNRTQRIIKNTRLDALGSIVTLGAVNLRHEMNSLTKRMGELRDSPEGVGAWVRLYGSENEYGAQNVTAKNNTVQVGSDVSVGDWKVGAAFSYTDGDASYDAGSGDSKTYGFAVYGTWFADNG